MFDAIVNWSVRSRLLVVLGLMGLLAACALLIPTLKLDAFPDVTNIQVIINTQAPGLAAEEVEQLITFPVESVMYALPDIAEVRSVSKTGLSVVTVVFKEGTDLYFARQLVFERLQAAREQIPDGVGVPEMGPNTSGLGQVFQYALQADDPKQYDAMALRSLNDWVVKLMLAPVSGVTQVLSFGGDVRQYQVQVNPERLLAQKLTIEDLSTAIENNNRNAGGWYVDRAAEQLVLRGVGFVRSGEEGLHDIANVPVKNADGISVKVSDVAHVAFGPEIRQGATSMSIRDAQGQPKILGEVVTGIVLKRMGANTKATIDGIKARLPAIQKALPAGVKLVPFYDQSDLVSKAVNTVSKALLEAFVLIVLVLALFLMNLRATLLVLISIPISIGLALAAMAYWDVSANLMSLGGLAIAIGMMVDGSVVMMENIFKHLSEPDHEHEAHAKAVNAGDPDPYDAAHDQHGMAVRIIYAAREVGRPVFFAVLIIIVVFMPLFSLEGVEGKMFQPMAVSIVLAMLASLIVALTVIPALSTYLFKSGVKHRESPVMPLLNKLYGRVLQWAVNRQKIVTVTAVALFVGALALVPLLGSEFVPTLEEGTLGMRVTLAPSVNMKTALDVSDKIERRLMDIPEITYVLDRIGRPELGGDPEDVSNLEWYIGVKPVEAWQSVHSRAEMEALIGGKLADFPGIAVGFGQPIATRVDELLSGVRAQLAIKLFGTDLAVLAQKGAEIEALTRRVSGTKDVALEQIEGQAQLVVRPNRDVLARYGIPVAKVMDLVANAIGGKTAGQVIRGNERYDIYVRLDEPFRNSSEAIKALVLQGANGTLVRLGDVAQVGIESGPPQIRRDDVQRRVVIQANVEGRDMGSVVKELDERIAREVKLPSGYSVVFGGQFENQQRAQHKLMIVVPLSLAMIFLLLFFAFNSVGQALLIMVNVPLSLIGGIVALFVTGQYLSVPGSIGFIALFGVAVLNGVVMVTAINQRFSDTNDPERAVQEGAFSRLRPVLMTAFIAALGLIPMLLSHGIGSEIQRPLATVVVGGLVSSTLLTLIVLPALYRRFSQGVIADDES
ncbi:MAG: efflux RND transporter permease subunit [Pseudomonadales bacterium]|nr:efflux RND transporter permease subunit [Pseudomonadales bacterium]